MLNANKTCATCALLAPDRPVCRFTGREVNPNENFCSEHVSELKVCDLCGQPYIGPDIIHCQEGGTIYITCQQCQSQMGTCATCSHGNECSFETDPSPIPPVVNQTFRQGNMTMSTQVRNPERIKITCEKGCSCWNSEHGCCKEYNTCAGYNFIGF